MASSFGRDLTLGVEEELMLLDPETLALASYYAWEAAGRPVHAVRGK